MVGRSCASRTYSFFPGIHISNAIHSTMIKKLWSYDTTESEQTKCRIEPYESLLGIIIDFRACRSIFQLFLQLGVAVTS